MEKTYKIVDVSEVEERVVFECETQYGVKEWAYGIMKDRVENAHEEDDELAIEFKEIIKDGVDGIAFDHAVELLSEWEYAVVELE